MDKATRALIMAEDAAVQTAELHREVKACNRAYLALGKSGYVNGIESTIFGTLEAHGDVAINLAFAGGSTSLYFDKNIICGSSMSPHFAVIKEGRGVLRLTGTRTNARMLITGAATFTAYE